MLSGINKIRTKIQLLIREKTGYDTGEFFFIIFIATTFIITLIRAAITQITYDEAFTYLQWCKPAIFRPEGARDIYLNSNANNHLLNTYLITLFDHFLNRRYNEFVIRLPQLIFFFVYLFMIIVLFHKKLIPSLVAVFLGSNYYLDEFYGLARGYAMCNTLVLCACASYLAYKRSDYEKDRYLVYCSMFFAMAMTANTVVLLLLPSFGIMWLMGLNKKKKLFIVLRKYALYLILWAGFVALMTGYHMIVTQQKTLFTGLERGFFECYFVSVGSMFIGNMVFARVLGALLALLLLLLSVLLIYLGKLKDCDFFIGLLVFLAVSVIAQLIFKKGYATEREMIPFYAFFVYAVWEAVSAINMKWEILRSRSRMIAVCSGVLCILLVLNFYRQIDINATRDWNFEYGENGNYDYGLKEHAIKQYIISQGDWDRMTTKPVSESELFYITGLDDIYINAR